MTVAATVAPVVDTGLEPDPVVEAADMDVAVRAVWDDRIVTLLAVVLMVVAGAVVA